MGEKSTIAISAACSRGQERNGAGTSSGGVEWPVAAPHERGRHPQRHGCRLREDLALVHEVLGGVLVRRHRWRARGARWPRAPPRARRRAATARRPRQRRAAESRDRPRSRASPREVHAVVVQQRRDRDRRLADRPRAIQIAEVDHSVGNPRHRVGGHHVVVGQVAVDELPGSRRRPRDDDPTPKRRQPSAGPAAGVGDVGRSREHAGARAQVPLVRALGARSVRSASATPPGGERADRRPRRGRGKPTGSRPRGIPAASPAWRRRRPRPRRRWCRRRTSARGARSPPLDDRLRRG